MRWVCGFGALCLVVACGLASGGCNGLSRADCIVIVDNPSGGGSALRAGGDGGGEPGAGDSGGGDAGGGGK